MYNKTVEITHLPEFLNDSLINVKSFRMFLNFFTIITEKRRMFVAYGYYRMILLLWFT